MRQSQCHITGRQSKDDSDDGRLDGLGDGEEGTEFALQARRAFDANWRYWLDTRVVTGDNGTLGLVGVGRRFSNHNDGTGSELAIAVVYHEEDFANKDLASTQGRQLGRGWIRPI